MVRAKSSGVAPGALRWESRVPEVTSTPNSIPLVPIRPARQVPARRLRSGTGTRASIVASNTCFQPVHEELHPLGRAIFFSSYAKSVAALGKEMHFDGYVMFDAFLSVER